MNGRRRTLRVVGTAALLLGGACIDSRPIETVDLDAVYRIDPSPWRQAEPKTITVDDRTLPYRYEMIYEPSPMWSVISLHETFEELPRIHDTVIFQVSQRHADAMGELLRRLAGYLEQLGDVLEHLGSRSGERRWASLAADLLLELDAMVASVSPDIERRRNYAHEVDDSSAWVLIPLLQTLSKFLTEEVPTVKLPPEVVKAQAEAWLGSVILRTSFRLTGREMPPDLASQILTFLRQRNPRRERRDRLIGMLSDAYAATPARYPALRRSAEQAGEGVAALAQALEFLADLGRQWQRCDLAALEIRELDGQPLVGLEFAIRPGEKVELKDIDALAPEIEFVGRGRIVIQFDRDQEVKHTRVLFSSEGAGSVILRFGGLVYGLADVFAFPLDDAYLREIRYTSRHDPEQGKVRTVEILMEALEAAEPRRLIRVDRAKKAVLVERPDLPPRLSGRRKTLLLKYYRNQRVYEYHDVDVEKPELWGYREVKPGS